MQKIIKSLAVVTAVCIAKILPFNWIVGSEFAMFSWTSIVAPVIAKYCGLLWIGSFLLSSKLLTLTSLGTCMLHRLPLFFSARAFIKNDVLISVVVPMMCIVSFVIHPVGVQAWLYAMYWLIPMALWAVSQSVWSRALQASFIAHAVGSVVWLYTGTISAETWMSLIPLVVVERCAMAVGIVVCDEVCTIFIQQISMIKKRMSAKVM